MKYSSRCFSATAIVVVLISGCSSSQPQSTVDRETPLTVAAWRSLAPAVKYEFETLELLRANEPKLENERAWSQFMRDVVVPQRQVEFPHDY